MPTPRHDEDPQREEAKKERNKKGRMAHRRLANPAAAEALGAAMGDDGVDTRGGVAHCGVNGKILRKGIT